MTAGGMEGEGEAAGTSSAAALGDTATETGCFFLLTFLLFTLFLSTSAKAEAKRRKRWKRWSAGRAEA